MSRKCKRTNVIVFVPVLLLGMVLGYIVGRSKTPNDANVPGLANKNKFASEEDRPERAGTEEFQSAARTVEITFGSDKEDMILLPERSLDYFLFRCFSDNTGLLERTLAKDKGLSEDKVIRVDAIATEAFNAMAAIEKQSAELRTDQNGGEYYYIPPFEVADVERIEAAMYSALKLEVGEGLAKLITHSAKIRGQFFASFGDGGQEISILEEPGIGGANYYKLEYKYFDRDGNRRGSGSAHIEDVDRVRVRYGHLFRRE